MSQIRTELIAQVLRLQLIYLSKDQAPKFTRQVQRRYRPELHWERSMISSTWTSALRCRGFMKPGHRVVRSAGSSRSASTVGRELRRNTLPRGGYKPASADRLALSRRRRLSRIERLSPLRSYVCDRLAMGWSPEQIAGRLEQEGSGHSISHESIYRFIYRPRLHRFLPRAKATRGRRYFKRRRDPIPGRTSIHERPRAVETREQFGHWEGDLMQFRTQRGNLLTPCERKTRFTFTAPLPSKQAETTDDALREILGPLPEPARRSVTFDNGSEFALHENLNAELATQTYFCDPHSPWQRGTIENTNGLLRPTCPEKPTFMTTPPATSTTSPGPSTQHPENPSASKHPPKPSSKTSGAALDL